MATLCVVAVFVWATATWQTGWIAWLSAAATALLLLWAFLALRRRRRFRVMLGWPTPPVDVRAVMADCRVIPVDCVYTGLVDGVHEWRVPWTLPELPATIRTGTMLPPRTAVSLTVKAPQ